MNNIITTFGERLKDCRTEYNITQKQLADYLECSKATISQMENDNIKNIKGFQLKKISERFNVSIDWLLGVPNSVKELNVPAEVKDISKYTGLTPQAIEELHSINRRTQNELSKAEGNSLYPFDSPTVTNLINAFIENINDSGMLYNVVNYNENKYYEALEIIRIMNFRKNLLESDKLIRFKNATFDRDIGCDIEMSYDNQKKYLDKITDCFKTIVENSSYYNQTINDLWNELDKVNSSINTRLQELE